MPKIPVYTNQEQINPGPLGEAARGAATSGYYRSNMIKSGFNALGEGAQAAYKKITEESPEDKEKAAEDLANNSADGSYLEADLAIKWQQMRDGSDPKKASGLAQKFIDEVATPAFEKYGEGVSTERGRNDLQKRKARMMEHLLLTTHADEVNLSQKAAVSGAQDAMNNRSRAVTTDPLSWQHSISEWKEDVVNLGLAADDRLRMETEGNKAIAAASFNSLLNSHPEVALEFAKKQTYGSIFNGDQYAEMQSQAEGAIVGQRKDVNATMDAEHKKLEADRDQEITKLNEGLEWNESTRNFDVPPDYFAKLKEIEKRSAAAGVPDPEKFEHYRSVARTMVQGSDLKHSDNLTLDVLHDKLHKGALTIEDIAAYQSKLTPSDQKYFIGKMHADEETKQRDKEADAFLQAKKKMFTFSDVTAMGEDPRGEDRYQDYRQDMLKQLDKFLEKGKTKEDWEAYVRSSFDAYRLPPLDLTEAIPLAPDIVAPVLPWEAALLKKVPGATTPAEAVKKLGIPEFDGTEDWDVYAKRVGIAP